MMKKTKSISLFLSIVLVMQLVLPFTSVFAADIQAPTNLKIINKEPGSVQLDWGSVPNVSTYNVYKVNGAQKEIVRKVTKGRTTTKINSLKEGKYTYGVTSETSTGESQLSNIVEAEIIYPEFFPPTKLESNVINGNTVVLNWASALYADHYIVYEVIDGQRVPLSQTLDSTFTLNNVTEAIHVYEVTSYSSVMGESKTAASVNVALINQTVQTPVLDYVVSNETDIKLTWPAVEYATSYDVYQLINGSPSLIATTKENSAVFGNLADGEYSYEVKAVSDIFGKSDYSNVVTIQIQSDSNAPVTTTNITDGWYNEQFVVELTATDDKQVNQTFYSVNGSVYSEGTNFTISEEGVNEVSFYSVDKAGNKEDVKTAQVKVDRTAPETTSNIGDQWIKEGSVIELTATDNVSGVSTTYYSVNGSEYVEGTSIIVNGGAMNTVSVYSVDNAGNIEEAKTVEVKIDQSAPETTSNLTSDWHKEYLVELSATDNRSGVDKTYYSINGSEYVEGINFTVSEEGVNEVSFYSVDKAGNKEEVQTVEVKIDQTAPTTTSNVGDQWLIGESVIDLIATDTGSGVATTYYSVDGSEYIEGTSVIVNDEDIKTVSFYSVDNAGNIEEPKTVEVKIDQSAPETTSNVTSDWHKEYLVELSVTDNRSGVDKTYYSINGSEYVEGINFTVSEEGVNEVAFYSVDNAGNKEEVQTIEVKTDQSAPETVSNVTEEWSQEVTVELTAQDDLSGVSTTFYSVNGSEYAEGTSFKVTEEGVNEVSFYSVDKAGNKEEVQTVEVKIDQSAPETVSNVTEEWSQEFTVELTAQDGLSGVSTTYYSVNGSEYAEGTSFTVTEEGVNEVSFYSVDKAGNKEDAKTTEVNIDQTAPETISNAVDQWSKEGVVVELTATDNASGVFTTYYSVNGSEYAEGTSFTVTEEGVNEVSFYSVDNAGNKAEVQTIEVKIDQTVPTVFWDIEDAYALGKMLPLTYTTEDVVSGIAVESLTVNGKSFANGETISFVQPGNYNVQVTVTDNAGWTTTLEKTIVVYIPVKNFKVSPGVIKGNNGVFSVEVSLPKGFDTDDFILESVTINGVSAISGKKGFEKQAEKGQFRFNREDFKWNDGEQALEFSGMLGDYLVVGNTTVEVKGSNNKGSDKGNNHGFGQFEFIGKWIKELYN